jgi:hypothetical protein
MLERQGVLEDFFRISSGYCQLLLRLSDSGGRMTAPFHRLRQLAAACGLCQRSDTRNDTHQQRLGTPRLVTSSAANGGNRVVLQVQDLVACAAQLKGAGLRFRSAIEVGPGDKQVQVEDPDGKPIELLEPARS